MKSTLTLVEGEGSVVIVERDGVVERVYYEVTEAPRFFEYIARGRELQVVVDLLSRVCGLCGVSYALLAAKAFERCLGVEVDEWADRLREALHLAERVKSHALHVFTMNLPEVAGSRSILELSSRNPGVLAKSLELVGAARRLMEALGGRMHNAVNVGVGGVYKPIDLEEARRLSRVIESALKVAIELGSLVLSFEPRFRVESSRPLLSVYSDRGYPHHGSKLLMSGRAYSLSEFYGALARSIQEEHSTALHYRLYGVESYIVGPLARFNNYHHALRKEARELLESHGWSPPVTPGESYVARVAEIVDALVELRELFEEYRPPSRPRAVVEEVVKEPATCEYAVEAPRGVLYGRFVVGSDLKLLNCDLVTPTAQNLAAMGDIATEILRGRPLSEEAVKVAKSVAIAFDPCISCSVHTLRVRIVKLR